MPDNTEKKSIIRRVTEGFTRWCAEDSTAARFERTLAQGVIAVVATGLTTGEWDAAFAVALVMAVLTPVQAEIGKGNGEDE